MGMFLHAAATPDHDFRWGSSHWAQTTWNKVHVTAAVYELGFHVIHSDADVTWFRVRATMGSRKSVGSGRVQGFAVSWAVMSCTRLHVRSWSG